VFTRWGYLIYRRRWATIVLGGLFGVIAAGWGVGVFGALSAGGFSDPDSESARATALVEQASGRTTPDVVVLYRSDDATVDNPSYERSVTASLAALPDDHVRSATSYWSARDEQLVSTDRHSTYATLVLRGASDTARATDYEAVRKQLDVPGLQVQRGGAEAVFADVSEQVAQDVKHAEMLSMPLVLVLCIVIYGSVVAASLPLLVGGMAVLGAFAAVRGITLVSDVSIFSINIITLLGLGLAIDYALFVVTRFREELARSDDVESAIVATVRTAGRTIVWSGLTVALSLASLLMFPQTFLRSMGVGGVAAVLVAMAAALTVLPAVLAVLGHRVDSLRLFRGGAGRRSAPAADEGAWARLAHGIMRRPVLFAVAGFAILAALGTPFVSATFGGVDERSLPASTESRQVSEAIADDFPGGDAAVAEVVTTGLDRVQVDSLGTLAREVPGVRQVATEQLAGGTAKVRVVYDAEAQSAEARGIVDELRHLPVPDGGTAMVRGESAELVDLLGSLGSTLPWMALAVAATTFVLLFLAFGSVVVPLKAIAMAAISLGASFGVVVWIFQDGHGADLLGFTPTGYVDATQPILMLAVLFGLSMDYELFLLSRVREEWDRSHNNTHAIAIGLQRTGRIISSAALLLVVVVAGFSTSGITFIKMMGVGMIVALVVDATLVRAVLVPAMMRLLGDSNWYAPAALARWWAASGLREHDTAHPNPGTSPPLRNGGRRRYEPRHRAERVPRGHPLVPSPNVLRDASRVVATREMNDTVSQVSLVDLSR